MSGPVSFDLQRKERSGAKALSRLIFVPIFLVALVLAVAACGSDDEGDTAAPADTASDSTGATETTKEPAEVNVALDWFANPDHIGLFYAQENGYFEDENLDVTKPPPRIHPPA